MNTVSKAKKKAWDVFSKFIRNRDTNYLGTECYTCGRYYPIERMHAGHFQPGRFPIFLFDERQCHAQCYRDNINLKGNWPRYYEHMVQDYGLEEVEKMIAQRNNFKQWKVFELEEIYLKYKALI
jgi:Bacteriophage Lambda NinG protein